MKRLREPIEGSTRMIDNRLGAHIDFDAPAALRKWPSLQNERRGTAPFLIMDGTLDECIRMYMTCACCINASIQQCTFAPSFDAGCC
jgi:hypothetical protein